MHAKPVWNERALPDGRTGLRPSLEIAYPKLKIRETFYSDVVCDPKALTVRATSTREPLKHLDSRWLSPPQARRRRLDQRR